MRVECVFVDAAVVLFVLSFEIDQPDFGLVFEGIPFFKQGPGNGFGGQTVLEDRTREFLKLEIRRILLRPFRHCPEFR